MANRPNVFAEGRHILPTQDLYITRDKFGSNVPAYNNVYDVWIDFSGKGLTRFINQHTFYDKGGRGSSPGSALALFCSEAILPGSTIETAEVRGLRQGVVQNYATYRSYPDITLTWYTQQDYYTNDVFNAWMEYISPTRLADSRYGDSTRTRRNDKASFRRLKYPEFYKCNMQITSFSKPVLSQPALGNQFRGRGTQGTDPDGRDFDDPQARVSGPDRSLGNFPSSITYYVENLFPTNIVASPLAYGKSELVKTSVTFKYEYYYIDRTSRVGETLKVSDSGNNRRTDSMNDARASQGTDNAGRDFDDQDFNLSGDDGFTMF
tara:strand:+ start:702 stop:1664 length:963 start_codon:yes stop_codon:yes gene_type:complete